MVYGRKQASTYINTLLQCSPASVGLAQAHPNYRIARDFCGVKFAWKLIRISFRNFIFADSDPIAIINDVNIVLRIKIFMGGDKKITIANHKTPRNFLAIQ